MITDLLRRNRTTTTMSNMAAPPTAAPRMTAMLFWERSEEQKKQHQNEPVHEHLRCNHLLGFFPTYTFNQGLKLFLHAGASGAVVTAEGLHPEEVGCPWRQLMDLYIVLLK